MRHCVCERPCDGDGIVTHRMPGHNGHLQNQSEGYHSCSSDIEEYMAQLKPRLAIDESRLANDGSTLVMTGPNSSNIFYFRTSLKKRRKNGARC